MRPAITLTRKIIKRPAQVRLELFPGGSEFSTVLFDLDPFKAIQSGKLMAKAWSKSFENHPDHRKYCHTFIHHVIRTYWCEVLYNLGHDSFPDLPKEIELVEIDFSSFSVAKAIGLAASKLQINEGSHLLSNLYTSILPESFRSENGVFYTPPSLVNRLIDMVEETGVDWAKVSVIDPACGSGAFLLPIALRMLKTLKHQEPLNILKHIEKNLAGQDIDPFGAWLAQVFLEIALKDITKLTGTRVASVITVGNALEIEQPQRKYDVVIGNPPYGKIKLTTEQRNKYKRGLYGHANLYGLFTDVALRLVNEGGKIGYVTPTSFLSGEYFKNLRRLLRDKCTPVEVNFVSFRKGVFEDVLQEIMLATYINTPSVTPEITIKQITPFDRSEIAIHTIGAVHLNNDYFKPWILARTVSQQKLVKDMEKMRHTLADWGYGVSTGPLVWNRHKEQLNDHPGSISYPIIWAESITGDGRFVWKTEKKNHSPYFSFKKGDDWLIINKPCVLLQRTTAKEQHKRLIAAALPIEFIHENNGVVIENHINMVIPISEKSARVSIEVLSSFLNSKVVNDSFRCVSGSVAISAYELESLPLPAYTQLNKLDKLIRTLATLDEIEAECRRIYSLS